MSRFEKALHENFGSLGNRIRALLVSRQKLIKRVYELWGAVNWKRYQAVWRLLKQKWRREISVSLD